MPRKFVLDCSEANYAAAGFHIITALLALCALTSNDWIYINSAPLNGSLPLEEAALDLMFELSSKTEKCEKIGCFDFWNPVRFGGFFDHHGKTHIAFHAKGRVLIDCVTPVVANIFYVIIALTFVMAMTAILSATIAICTPPNPFLQWLRRNTIAEMCNMIITLFCCTMALMAQSEVAQQRPDEEEVTLGAGVILVSLCGLFSFGAAVSHIRHTHRMNRMRRMDNQRIMCSRSLRSWRDAARRREDTLPIMDFERYIDPPTAMEEIPAVHVEIPAPPGGAIV